VIYARNQEADYRPSEMAEPLFSDPLYDVSWRLVQESYGLELTS
jgi:hypothetical protein